MGLPKYPLQTILDQRSRGKEDAKKAFANALRALDAEQMKLRQLEEEKQGLIVKREDCMAHLYDPDEAGMLSVPLLERRRGGIQHIGFQIEEKTRAIVAQTEAVKKAEQEVDARKAALVEADKELKAIEKHRENWLTEVKREMAQKEQKLSEEIALARFVRDTAEQAEEEADGKQ